MDPRQGEHRLIGPAGTGKILNGFGAAKANGRGQSSSVFRWSWF
jgi:hypothetical protein